MITTLLFVRALGAGLLAAALATSMTVGTASAADPITVAAQAALTDVATTLGSVPRLFQEFTDLAPLMAAR